MKMNHCKSYSLLFFLFFAIFLVKAENKLRFIENKGQWHSNVKYRMKLDVGDIFLEKNKLTYSFWEITDWEHSHKHGENGEEHGVPSAYRGHAYQVSFVGANANPTLLPAKTYPEYHNYYIGNDKSKWAEYVKIYEEVRYQGLYAGVDMHFYAQDGYAKYDFEVQAGQNPDVIQLQYEGQTGIAIENGNLVISTSINATKELQPFAYQYINGQKIKVPCHYILQGNKVSFAFPNGYDKTEKLIIDPTLIFSTPTGSTASNFGFTATYDAAGNAYGGGNVFGAGYPTTPGAFQNAFQGGGTDAGITKFNPTGTTAIFSTYLGGVGGFDAPHSMIVDNAGDLIVMGSTGSNDFPATAGAFDNTLGGISDFFLAKFSPTGTIIAATFVGGTGDDARNTGVATNYGDASRGEVVVDDLNNIYVAGCASSADFPVTAGAYDNTANGVQDGVVFKMTPNLATMTWATYLGTTANDGAFAIKVDNNYLVYVSGGTEGTTFPTTAGSLYTTSQGGRDGFIAKLDANGANLLAGTYIGTTGTDMCFFLELNAANEVFVLGQTDAVFPINNTTYSMPGGTLFIAKLDNNLTNYIFSTHVASASMSPTAFLVDVCENIYVCGWGQTTGLPVDANAIQTTPGGDDFYLAVLTPGASSLLYATYWGGATAWEHVDGGTSRFDKNGVVYEAVCSSGDFPITPGAFSPAIGAGYNLSVFKIAFGFAGTNAAFVTTDSVLVPTDTFCGSFEFYYQNNSTNTPTTYYIWDFGDGSPLAYTASPSHLYTIPGTYTITLVAIDTVGTCMGMDTVSHDVTILQPLNTSFSMPPAVCIGSNVAVTYTGTTSGTLNYTWNFDGGLAVPGVGVGPHTVTWNTPGVKNVTLQTSDPLGCASIPYTQAITVDPTPTSDFVASSPICISDSSVVNYIGTASANALYNWNFDGGNAVPGGFGQGTHHVNWSQGGTKDLSLIVIENGCPSLATNVQVFVSEPPIPSFAYPDSICVLDANQVVFTGFAPANSQFNWNFIPAVMLSGAGAGPYTLSWTNAGVQQICLQITDAICPPSPTVCHNITVLDRPVAQIAPVANQCLGVNSFDFTYTGIGGIDAYYWGFPGGFPAYSSVANPTGITYTSAGNYTAWCYVVRNGCVSDTAYINFEVIADPSANFQITGVPFCQGSCTELTYTGTPVSTQQAYSWTLPATSSPVNSTLPNLSCVVFSALGQNQITLTVDNFGCIASTTQEIYIHPSPQVNAGIDRAFCAGTGPIQLFDTVANGTPSYLYSWWSNPAATGGITNPYADNPFVNPTDSGTIYYFQVQDMMGCKSNIDSAVVSIYALPISYAGPDKFICEHPGAFPVTLDGHVMNGGYSPGPYHIQWTPTTGMLQGQDTLWQPTVHPTSTTIYYLELTDAHGCSNVVSILDTMSTVTVNVNPLPAVEAGATQHLCFGDTTQLLGFAQGSNNYTYTWTPSNAPGNVLQPNNPTSMATPSSTTTYTLSVTAEGCTNTDTTTIVVHTLPTAAIQPPVTDICQGDSVLLTGLADGDPTGASYQYSWSPATGLSDPLSPTPWAFPTSTTTYNLFVKSQYCSGFADAITIVVRPTPIVSILNQDSTICAGEDMKLIAAYNFNGTAVFQPVVIQWTPALTCSNPTDSITFVQPAQTTVYTVQASAAGACPTTASIKVEVAPKPNATIVAPITTLCEGETAILTANGGFSASTYSWTPNTALNNTSTQQVICNAAGLDSLGLSPYTYTVWIQEGACTDSASVVITAYPLPIADYVMSNKTGCAPFTVVFGENATGETQYLWNFGDGSPVSNEPNPSHTYTNAGDYVVTFTATGLGGCKSEINSATISVSDGAVVDFSSNPTENDTLQIPNTQVIFTDMSQQAVSWQWEFGDGIISAEQNPSHYFVSPGTYTVTLTAINTHGCIGQTAKSYTITDPDLFIPNLFTPNGDGFYDEWNIQYSGKESIEINLFDRWGVAVFNSTSLEKNWDGTNGKGKLYSDGVYFYTVKVAERIYNGNITLMR